MGRSYKQGNDEFVALLLSLSIPIGHLNSQPPLHSRCCRVSRAWFVVFLWAATALLMEHLMVESSLWWMAEDHGSIHGRSQAKISTLVVR